jgi:tetratricopeptide (TPR) repeat protein
MIPDHSTKLDRLDETMADYWTIRPVDPDNPEYHDARLHAVAGRMHAERADFGAAAAAFDRALALDPDLVVALSGRAALAYRADDCESALVDLARAVDLAPDDPAPRFGRALVLQEMGRWAEALADLDAAAALAPDAPTLPPQVTRWVRPAS